jgi:hypothetical protein
MVRVNNADVGASRIAGVEYLELVDDTPPYPLPVFPLPVFLLSTDVVLGIIPADANKVAVADGGAFAFNSMRFGRGSGLDDLGACLDLPNVGNSLPVSITDDITCRLG